MATQTQQPPAFDGPTQKMLNHIGSMKGKLDKQGEEISKLKAELAKAKTSNSRIRRIPKKQEEEGKQQAPAVVKA